MVETTGLSIAEPPSSLPLVIPTDWTALASAGYLKYTSEWFEHNAPHELSCIPENLQVSSILADIVKWSLRKQSSEPPQQPQLASGNETAPPNCAHDSQISTTDTAGLDRDESSRTRDSDSQSHIAENSLNSNETTLIDRKLAKILNIKQEVLASAVEKITSLKERRGSGKSTSPGPDEKCQGKKDVPVVGECTSCFEDHAVKDLVSLDCTHKYCKPCLATLVMTALQNESAYPPKCCLSEIPLHTILLALNQSQREQYKLKSAEYSVPANNRWYCPNTECLKWIPPRKLHRLRASAQQCPHCAAKICSTCRGAAHAVNTDCPQDFGLEATLDVAESEGWRRCFRCRAMVELTSGCRHITCKCGAEFCYVCGAKWRTCGCTEADQINRQTALRRQRTERDEAALVEAEEVAAAIAEIEAMERREAEERRQEEERLELERQIEMAELARLEEMRLEEEAKRQLELEEAEKQLQAILRLSLEDGNGLLMKCLQKLIRFQHIALDDRHGREEQQLVKTFEKRETLQTRQSELLMKTMCNNIERRTDGMKARHSSECEALTAQQEEQEDDIFLQVQLHLRGKPNRETREKRLQDDLKARQEEDRVELAAKQTSEMELFQQNAKMELDILKRSTNAKSVLIQNDYNLKLGELWTRALNDRKWFDMVCRRRILMAEESGKRILNEFDAGKEPVGLTEAEAVRIHPFDNPTASARSDATPDLEVIDQQSPPLRNSGARREPPNASQRHTVPSASAARLSVAATTGTNASSSYSSTISLGSDQGMLTNAWTWMLGQGSEAGDMPGALGTSKPAWSDISSTNGGLHPSRKTTRSRHSEAKPSESSCFPPSPTGPNSLPTPPSSPHQYTITNTSSSSTVSNPNSATRNSSSPLQRSTATAHRQPVHTFQDSLSPIPSPPGAFPGSRPPSVTSMEETSTSTSKSKSKSNSTSLPRPSSRESTTTVLPDGSSLAAKLSAWNASASTLGTFKTALSGGGGVGASNKWSFRKMKASSSFGRD